MMYCVTILYKADNDEIAKVFKECMLETFCNETRGELLGSALTTRTADGVDKDVL